MHTDVGQASQPSELIPGDPAALRSTASQLRTRADLLHETGKKREETDAGGWPGPASESFRAAYARSKKTWAEAADYFSFAATALENYADTLAWAQREAADAIQLWRRAETLRSSSSVQEGRPATSPSSRSVDITDETNRLRAAAQDALDRARHQVAIASSEAASAIERARVVAPVTSNPSSSRFAHLGVPDTSTLPFDVAATARARINTGLERLFLALGPPPDELLSDQEQSNSSTL